MKIKFKSINAALILAVLITGSSIISCKKKGCTDSTAANYNDKAKKDDGSCTYSTVKSSGITIALKTTGVDETEFILNKEDVLSGGISAVGNGIEQTGWRFYYQVGKTLFATGYSTDNQCAGYVSNDQGKIVKKGEFIFENALVMFGASEEEDRFLGMEVPTTGFANRRLHFINVDNVNVSKIVGTRIFESTTDSLVAWPTALRVRGDKLFIPFHKLHARGDFSTPNADTAFVAVYSYPNVGTVPEKIIYDTRTSHIGTNGMTSSMILDDNGDIYSYSCGAEMAGFSPAATKPSGILKITDGSTEFDQNYFFDIEAATGGKLFWMDYVGGGKAIGRILTGDIGGAWAAYGRDVFNQKLVMIDLINETVTDIAGVPEHASRYSSPIFIENGYAYLSIETATDAYVYQVDVNTDVAVKGAKIEGKTIKGFYRL